MRRLDTARKRLGITCPSSNFTEALAKQILQGKPLSADPQRIARSLLVTVECLLKARLTIKRLERKNRELENQLTEAQSTH